MKRTIIKIVYFVFLFFLTVGIGYVFVWHLIDAIKNGENPFNVSIPYIARIMFFLFLAFVSTLVLMLISIIYAIQENRLKTIEERKQERKIRRDKRILQLNAKIEKLKNEDDD